MSAETSDSVRKQHQFEELVRQLHYDQQEKRDSLVGQILTIVDAAFTDPQQRKAVKDLMKGVLYVSSDPGDESSVHRLVRMLAETQDVEIFPDENYRKHSIESNFFAEIK